MRLNASVRACAAASIVGTSGQPTDAARHSLRPAGGRLRRQDHQHAAPVARRHARFLRLRRVLAAATSSAPLAETLDRRVAHARAVSRRLHRRRAGRCASCRSISWSPARWRTSSRRFRRRGNDWAALPDKVAIQLNDTHPDHRRARADAHPAGRGAAAAGTRRGT
ncbi:MAG: glycogen/starch/alpha-glucan phosphorylase [Comamonadaceae bacterium]|nr:glycogen/starch/alpha-glucan phosphorylase [Comamonadaceae bacterium]